MGTLASELGPIVCGTADRPRIYADANLPAGAVHFMRLRLRWDVLFVLEHPDLRRAADVAHYRMARQLGRTLLTLDHDYFDDRRFPPGESGGVIVLSAPDERGLRKILARLDRRIFQPAAATDPAAALLSGRKLHVHVGWPDADR